MRRAEGFTLLELTVAMLVSSLAIAGGFSVYRFVRGEMKVLDAQTQKALSWQTASATFHHDAFRARWIRQVSPDELVCESSSGEVVGYSLQSPYLIRRVEGYGPDTLSKELIDWAFEPLDFAPSLARRIMITLGEPESPKELVIHKEYAQADLMELYREDAAY